MHFYYKNIVKTGSNRSAWIKYNGTRGGIDLLQPRVYQAVFVYDPVNRLSPSLRMAEWLQAH